MKILLISVNNETEPYPVSPVGAAYVGAALKSRGHDVRILDLCFVVNDREAVSEYLESFKPDAIGLSIRNIDNLTFGKSVFYLPRVRAIVDFIRKSTPVPVIAGGSGFSIFPEQTLRYLGLDTGIAGEGEKAFAELLEAYEKGGDVTRIKNVCRLEAGEFRSNGPHYSRFDIVPERSLLDNGKYLEAGGMANIQTKRGCPFHCAYCTYPNIEGKTLRLRAPADVADELEGMRRRFGIDYVFFVDDIFNFPGDHASAICEEIIRRDLKIDWTCFATPAGMTSGMAGLMKRAGCKGVEFGSDAGTEATLRGLSKHFSTDDIANAVECCKKIDLPNAHYIIIGGPEEDWTTLERTFTFLRNVRPTAVIALTGLRIYPDTLLHARAVEEGIVSAGADLLEPAFYISPKTEAGELLRRVAAHAKDNHNWIVPGLNIRCDHEMLKLLRKKGVRGPMWDML